MKKKRILKRPSTSWGKVAHWYHDHLQEKSTYHTEVILPHLLTWLKPEKGQNIIDIACGNGLFAQEYAHRGAQVAGVDISMELIRLAKQSADPSLRGRLEFFTAPAHRLPFARSELFDAATIVLALQNIENVSASLRECARVLKTHGRLYLVMNHPAFRIPKYSSWGWDDRKQIQYRRVDAYLTETIIPIQMHPGDRPSEHTVSFHRPLQFYVALLAKNNFAITGLEEWVSNKASDSGPRATAENRARKEFPLFLLLEAVKIQ